MASKTGAYVAVLAGGVMAYSAFTHKRIIDVLLMRPSTLPQNNATTQGTGGSTQTGGQGATASSTPGSLPATTALRKAVCAAAIQAANEPQGTYQYATGVTARPYPPNLFGPPVPVKLDCSSFATLCYKYAGAPDPNGLAYSGQGYTGTLILKGRSVPTPNPADLAFWSNPDHVAVCLGNGLIIEFGAPPGPGESTISSENDFHSRFLGYRSYLPTS